MKYSDNFTHRHIGITEEDTKKMLAVVGAKSLDQLMSQAIPSDIRLKKPLNVGGGISEMEYLRFLREEIASKNKVFQSFIGLGYYDTFTPPVILRNIFENPGWYTQYTPYQAEISQGRLEALLNFQTMVSDLTGLPVANASLLDEATAAAEAMFMTFNHKNRRAKADNLANVFLVSDQIFPQTLDVLRTRATGVGIEIVTTQNIEASISNKVFGAYVQYPNMDGDVDDFTKLADLLHAQESYLVVGTDLLALTLLKPPGEMGVDVAVGSAQRFGIPLGYGGPHAAFFAVKEEFTRIIPGRMIGVSVDVNGKRALRMTLQTREQHIRREKATSNICTAQALLAIMSGMYAVYHGPQRLKEIALRVHSLTACLHDGLKKMGVTVKNNSYFGTVSIVVTTEEGRSIRRLARRMGINFFYSKLSNIYISLDEKTNEAQVEDILGIFSAITRKIYPSFEWKNYNKGTLNIPASLVRTSPYLTHPVFNSYHNETAMMRYIKSLENKDLSLNMSMIPLGSCTMKLNAATELIPVSWPEFNGIHPFAPTGQTGGYSQMIEELEAYLCEITGFAAASLQPNSGAQGEYAGLLVIREYHKYRRQWNRNVIIIPASAHGTNPASAAIAGFQIVVSKTAEDGTIDVADFRNKVVEHRDNFAGAMITYPSTHGVFEENIVELANIIHRFGGLFYMDGANMNAQVGLTSPAAIGADVCHLNLHKTFAIPHGGGGPGMGPICVTKALKPFLPGHSVVDINEKYSIPAVSAAPYGSASILLISYAYIKMLGDAGLKKATEGAILNANYLKSRLEKDFKILYTNDKGRVAHEFIIDLREFKASAGLETDDIVKRLIDYGFHAPTVSFPVAGTIMIEPTESEPLAELDRFVEAMLNIRKEIQEIIDGSADPKDNVLKNSPHTLEMITSDDWTHPYSRNKAAFPVPSLRHSKFWSSVGRVDNAYGDRNIVCVCPPIEAYQ